MISKDWHVTLRHALYVLGFCFCFFWAVQHYFPAPQPVHAPVAIITRSPVEHELHALEQSDKTISQTLKGVASVLQRPGATVFSKATGFSPAQGAQILSGTKPHVAQTVTDRIVVPTPAPMATDDLSKTIFNAAYAADTQALNKTTIKTEIGYQEVPTSRFGSAFIAGGGTGLSYAAIRRGHYELNLAAVLNTSQHAVPAICPGYQIPHTSLSADICGSYDHGFRLSLGAVEHF